MKSCFQYDEMSVYQHGQDVRSWYVDLKDHIFYGIPLKKEWRIPRWISNPVLKDRLSQIDDHLIELYQIFHDCGKPICRWVDNNGKQHFPNHVVISKERWLQLSDGSPEAVVIGNLIGMDMDIHVLKSDGVKDFAARPQAAILLCTGLSELHSNAQMFGGIGSPGFKMKFKNMDRFGARILVA